jgi:hypothetical protein
MNNLPASMQGSKSGFSKWQPIYAERGIAIIPCGDDKVPLVRNPQMFGRDASAVLAGKFSDASAFGYYCGRRNGITVLDVDTADERVLATALDRHGHTPIIIRTGSGKFHAPYRHNGERRSIRAWGKEVPIDLLGAGLSIAPPSIVVKGQYEIIEGHFDDLDRLPIMRELEDRLYMGRASGPRPRADWARMKDGDGRNPALFDKVLDAARYVDDYDQLLDYALTQNSQFGEPMLEAEVAKVTGNAWKIQIEGRNRKGTFGVWFPIREANELIVNYPDEYRLLSFLQTNNHPDSAFMVANGLVEKFGWSRQRLAAARERLIQMRYLRRVRHASNNQPALYRWHERHALDRAG